MAKSFGEFLFDQAKKAGMAEDNEVLKAFIQDNKELFAKTMPEEIELGIDNNLLSIKDAKNNHPDIRNHYYAKIYDNLDKTIAPFLFEVDEESKQEIIAEASTIKRIPLIFNKIRELESKKVNTSGKGDKDAIQKQIDDLHKQLADEKTNSVNLQKKFESDLSTYKTEAELDVLLSAYKTIYDDLDPEVKRTTLKTIINKDLQDNRVKFAFDDKRFTLLKEDGTNHYGDNHQQIEPKEFIEKTLSRNKLLKVSDQTTQRNGENISHAQPPGGNGNFTRNNTHIGLVQKAIQDLENANSTPIMG